MTGPMNEPNKALNVMATELIDASCSPSSIAFEVPRACAEVPKPIPRPIGVSILTHFKKSGPNKTPVNPAIITKIVANEAMPPILDAICMAMGVVIDLGSTVRTISFENPSSFANNKPLRSPTNTPETIPPRMGYRCSFNNSCCL